MVHQFLETLTGIGQRVESIDRKVDALREMIEQMNERVRKHGEWIAAREPVCRYEEQKLDGVIAGAGEINQRIERLERKWVFVAGALAMLSLIASALNQIIGKLLGR